MVEQFDAVDMNELFEDADRIGKSTEKTSNKDFLKNYVIMPEKEGFKLLRLLPPIKGKKLYCATRTHRLLRIDGDPKKARNLHCPRVLATVNGKKMWVDADPKNPCPICMYCRGLWKMCEAAGGDKTPEGKMFADEYRRIKAVERFYWNCIERVLDKQGEIVGNEGPKIFSTGVKLHEKILNKMLGNAKMRKKGLGDVTDVNTGRDLKVIKTLTPYPNYDDSDFEDPSPLGNPDEIAAWVSKLHDLAALRVVKSIEEIDIALQKYTGAIADVDDSTNFDMSKYTKKDASLEKQVAHAHAQVRESRQEEVKKEAPKPAPQPKGEEVLVESEWLEGLDKDIAGM